MITHVDDDPEFDPDDPLAVLLRPTSDRLGPPAGRYEEIRRGAARRRLARAAVGAGLTCAVAVLVALPLWPSAPDGPVSPTVPLAPPAVSGPSPTPTPSRPPESAEPRPVPRPPTDSPTTPASGVVPAPGPR
ncbi:hypothetical protein ABTY20_08345 [Streptomyces sp. NPDC126497]|uniref:hypothetical protein n=1 Tax=Streptomyces sp. NPDC126497 TaxID=3155313 RepID=UPI0033307197